MSLINKMLQDLDARGTAQGGTAALTNVMPVPREERRPALMLAGGAVLLLAALATAGYFGWRALRVPRAVAAAAAPTPTVPVKTVLLAPKPPAAAIAATVAPLIPAPEAEPAEAVEAPAPRRAEAKPGAKEIRREPRKEQAEEKLRLAAEQADAEKFAKPVKAVTAEASPRNLSSQQRAETEYRRALATLQEGRTGDAIAGLEQALQVEPRHEAARQTLVGLLIENRRPDEAMRQLQQALGAEPRQPAMAMLLARLQIERGGSGIDTLLRTLPYATGNGEYHAFLAGSLQRQQRHREAAEQYHAALRANGGNAVWLMGLGISLLAEKRHAEAIDAFQKASSSSSLSPELQAFVERKLQQLGR